MIRVLSWWRGLSGATRFRVYSRAALQLSVAGMAAAIAVASPSLLVASAAILSGVACLAAFEAYPGLSDWQASPELRRWIRIGASIVLIAVWIYCLVYTRETSSDEATGQGVVGGSLAALLWLLAVGSSLSRRWLTLIAVALATSMAFVGPQREGVALAALLFALGLGFYVMVQLTVWTLSVVDELEHAKEVEARLRVAEERVRFARDLHDVVGRGFSAVAVKSELAATLVNAGAYERAALEMNEVKTLAVESMGQMRALVRGYREIDLESEIAGAQSLLAATGCRLDVAGSPEQVPTQLHQAVAWIVREGTTNIVKHSAAKNATLALGGVGMSLTNDGVGSAQRGDGAGLAGLTERLAAVGATLDTEATSNEFTLVVRWENT